jgi:uncharacterized repeat protein (TIGR01451 family)
MKHYSTHLLLQFSLLCVIPLAGYAGNVKNNSGCSLTASITASYNTVCVGGSNGMLVVTASGGTTPYTYSWSPSGGTKDTANNLTAGSYTVTVTDFTGCTATATANIYTDAISVQLKNDTVCGGSCTGTLTPIVYSSSGPYNFQWSNSSFNPTATNLCAGTYSVTVMDANGCHNSASGSVTVLNNIPSLTLNSSIINDACAGNYNGAITLYPSAPTSPFRFEWDTTYGSNGLYNLPAGTYSVTLWDKNNNCNSLSYTVADTCTCGAIYGAIVNDTDFDCIFNSGEPGLNISYVNITPGGYVVYPDAYGDYICPNLAYGNYTVTEVLPSGSVFGACSLSQNVTVNSSTPAVNFLDTTHAKLSDPAITYVYADIPLPGSPYNAQFQIKNLGLDSSYGRVYINIPDSMTLISTSPTYSSLSHDTLYWNYSGLQPGDTLDFTINCMTAPLSSTDPMVSWTYVGILPYNAESNTQNDRWGDAWAWAYSEDPNEKSVSPVGNGPQGYINLSDSILTYTIHFQNTGTAPARNIYIIDTIDSHLDINSLTITGASNNYTAQVAGNKIKISFENINLPDSNGNPKGSRGWVQYTVKQKTSNKGGDVIHNTGYIYFDYNAPVVTNTTTNTINILTDISSLTQPASIFNIYPNPANDEVQVNYNAVKGMNTVEITDLLGKVIYSTSSLVQQQHNVTTSISTSSLIPGTYIVRITTGGIATNKKLVIIR